MFGTATPTRRRTDIADVVIVSECAIRSSSVEAAVRARAIEGRTEFHLVYVDRSIPLSAAVACISVDAGVSLFYPELSRQSEAALADDIKWLASLGISASGVLVDASHTYTAGVAAAKSMNAAEIIFVTGSRRHFRSMHRRLVPRVRRAGCEGSVVLASNTDSPPKFA
jgi:hypothetical protein